MLTVVTHTKGIRKDLLKRCQESVARALPKNARHVIVTCHEYKHLAKQVVDSCNLDDYIAFVDDDDTIHPESLNWCMQATSFNTGLIFTNEVVVDETGLEILSCAGIKTYQGIANHPRTAHHLCVVKGGLTDPGIIDIDKAYGLGFKWLISSSIALTHGAIHIPRFAYNWTRHKNESLSTANREKYTNAIPHLAKQINQRWGNRNGKVEIFVPV